ncbi:hypothetical protein Cgig2_011885 [Carnegiea gigantea]|uniref:Uncharacterized protein n=1 Tax=Carnegiea gigantea TaxID=171969 RepID=A0A9Q1QE19_9CARY|nr:hypothetical protein Cgig2_011885 [Carnegiea gigantea]
MKSDPGSQTLHLGTLPSITNAGARGWGDCQVIFDDLGMTKGQHTETFLATFLSCWLCTFILSVRDTSCIRPDTFNDASFTVSGVRYCLLMAILASICKGLNEISHSSHPGRVKPSHFSSKRPKNSLVLRGAFVDVHPSPTNLRRLSWMMASYREMTLLILSAFIWVLSLIIVRTTSSWSTTALIDLVDNLVFIRVFLLIWTLIIFLIQKQCFIATTCSHAMEQGLKYYFLGDAIFSREIPLMHFMSGGLRCSFYRLAVHMPKQSDLSHMNISKDKDKLGSKPKLKIVHSGKLLEPFVPPMEDGSSSVKIPGIVVAIPAIPIPAIPTEDKLPIGVCEPSIEKVIELPSEGAENIMDILDAEPIPAECINFKEELAYVPLPSRSQCFLSIGRIPSFGKNLFDSRSSLDGSKGVCSSNDDKVESICRAITPSLRLRNVVWVFGKAILDKESRTPFDGIPSLKGDFDSLYATILQRGVDITPLESEVEGMWLQGLVAKLLRSNTAEKQDSCRIEAQSKLNEASWWLNTEGDHYEAKAAELKQVESRHEELLKELQLLEDQTKYLSFKVAAREHLLQETEGEVIDLQGQIDIINATKVMDATTKASLEKTEVYIKTSFEDLKNFQWNP